MRFSVKVCFENPVKRFVCRTATTRYDYANPYDAAGNLKKYTTQKATGTLYLQTYT